MRKVNVHDMYKHEHTRDKFISYPYNLKLYTNIKCAQELFAYQKFVYVRRESTNKVMRERKKIYKS